MLDKRGAEEHTRTHAHTPKTIQFLFCFVNTFHNRNSETTTQSLSMLSKNLTNGNSGLSNKHDTCSTLCVEGLSTVKGHLSTAYMAYISLQGQRKCVHPNTTWYIHCLMFPAHGQNPCFMFRSGLMHGEIHPEHSWEKGSKETVMTNHTNKKNI